VSDLLKDVEALVRLFERTDWDEMRLEVADLRLVLSNNPNTALKGQSVTAAHSGLGAPTAGGVTLKPVPASGGVTTAAPFVVPDGLVVIKAPNLGTFWRAPKPGAAPYVEIGQTVDDTTEVCLIEVMKLFTPVKSGIKGKIVQSCVEDGVMVEYGTPLFLAEAL
jgi:acetyl-CoA carboxylase biotin carboxyl carrier protein